MAATNDNTGPKAVQTLKDESLIADAAKGVATPGFISGGVAATEEALSGIGIDTTALIESIPDLSLTSGINIDSFFDLGGQINNPFGIAV